MIISFLRLIKMVSASNVALAEQLWRVQHAWFVNKKGQGLTGFTLGAQVARDADGHPILSFVKFSEPVVVCCSANNVIWRNHDLSRPLGYDSQSVPLQNMLLFSENKFVGSAGRLVLTYSGLHSSGHPEARAWAQNNVTHMKRAVSMEKTLCELGGFTPTEADKVASALRAWIAAEYSCFADAKNAPGGNGIELHDDVVRMYSDCAKVYGISSCMVTNAGSASFLNFYNANTEVVKGAVIYERVAKKSAVLGRTLIWGGKFYDRIYGPRSSEAASRLQSAGYRPIAGSNFAAIVKLPASSNRTVPYFDNVSWGASLTRDYMIISTKEHVDHKSELGKRLNLVKPLQLSAWKYTDGGPMSSICVVSGALIVNADDNYISPFGPISKATLANHGITDPTVTVDVTYGGEVYKIPRAGSTSLQCTFIRSLFLGVFKLDLSAIPRKDGTYVTVDRISSGLTIRKAPDGSIVFCWYDVGLEPQYFQTQIGEVVGVPFRYTTDEQIVKRTGCLKVYRGSTVVGYAPAAFLSAGIRPCLFNGEKYISLTPDTILLGGGPGTEEITLKGPEVVYNA